MKRFGTDHPSDPDRARIQAASDRASAETRHEENETFGVEMFLAKQAVERAIAEYARLRILTPEVGRRMLAAMQDAQRRLELAVKLYDQWRPSHWGLEPKL